MANLASLVVSLEANIARFESDLTKAEQVTRRAMDTIANVSESAMKAVKGALAGMVAAYTFDAFADGIKGAIESAAELDQMAKKTGASVEALSGLKSAAKLSGTSLEEVGGGLQKLSKAMYEAAGGSQKQVDLFKTLGITTTDASGKLRDSGEVMLDLAKKLDSMDSSTQAVATAQLLLGKRGAELLPFMQDLAEIGELNARVTSQMAAEADAYEKNLIRLEGRKKSLYTTIAAGVLPAMVDFTDALLNAGSMTQRLNEQAKQMQQDNVIESWARNAARFVAALVDVFDAVIRVIRIVGNAIAAVAADIVSMAEFTSGLGQEMLSERSLDPVRRRFAKLTADMRSHAESLNEDMARIWNAPLFLTKLEEQFAQRDAGLKKLEPPKARQTFEIPDQREGKTSPFESYLNSLNVDLIRDKLGKYEGLIEKGRLLAEKEGRLGDMAKVTSVVSQIQTVDESKRIDAFVRGLDQVNDQYRFQISLIGMNAKEQEIANATRRSTLAVEQQIWDAEKSGSKLSIEAQQQLRSEAERSNQVMVQAINARWAAQQKFDDDKRVLAFAAREQEIATVARKNFLAVEQQIWEFEQSGMKMSVETQQRLRDEAVRSTAVMVRAINERYEAERSWETGAKKAINGYLDSVTNAAAQSERLFSNAFKSMEDALVGFVRTGKLDFRSLADSIIADLIRIQIQNSIMKPLAQATSGMSFSGLFSGAGTFFSNLFRASGGPVSAGQPYVVGEQGPEWFVPNAAGTVLPNGAQPVAASASAGNQGPININFSVNAMDARSFQTAMVQNKAVVVGIVNQALNMRGRYGITG
ncbi:MAG: hypothetical protein EBU75_05620 [Betaproteobacteria bacterium]|nr:hypothetical protein [Betaproteobacteria bacterium]